MACNTLKFFFREEDDEYKYDVLSAALHVEKCSNLNQLQTRLDLWLNRISNAIKLNKDNEKYFDNMSKFVMLRKLLPIEMENTIRTNKLDYGDYQKALAYVQASLARHYERSHPIPMDIDAADIPKSKKHVQFEELTEQPPPPQPQQQQQQQEDDHAGGNEWDEYGDCDSSFGCFWGVGAVGKKGKGKSGKGFVDHKDRQCYNCHQYGHIAANCPKGRGKGKGDNKGGSKNGGKGGKGWHGGKGWYGNKGSGGKGGFNKGGFAGKGKGPQFNSVDQVGSIGDWGGYEYPPGLEGLFQLNSPSSPSVGNEFYMVDRVLDVSIPEYKDTPTDWFTIDVDPVVIRELYAQGEYKQVCEYILRTLPPPGGRITITTTTITAIIHIPPELLTLYSLFLLFLLLLHLSPSSTTYISRTIVMLRLAMPSCDRSCRDSAAAVPGRASATAQLREHTGNQLMTTYRFQSRPLTRSAAGCAGAQYAWAPACLILPSNNVQQRRLRIDLANIQGLEVNRRILQLRKLTRNQLTMAYQVRLLMRRLRIDLASIQGLEANRRSLQLRELTGNQLTMACQVRLLMFQALSP